MTSIHFPNNLLALETAWQQTYEDMARQPPGTGTTTHRRRLLNLDRAISAHPFWAQPGRSPAARVELRLQARALRWVEAA
ncbi:hypothetical protein ABZ667_40830 [Streptomyces lavendulae]|uniref:hypothetical protein n=1 Tax=Streptomyces lavendulae TaxID=1914 RepID=UPI0034092264